MPPDDFLAYQEYTRRAGEVIEAVQRITQCGFDIESIHPIAFDLVIGLIRNEVMPRTLDLFLHFPNSDYMELSRCLLGQ